MSAVEIRNAVVRRKSQETTVEVELSLDGRGEADVRTGSRIFDHFLSQIARHGLFDLKIAANGADVHHVVEDVAICLGQAFYKALGEKRGISRMGWALVPMDEALVQVAVDLGGRGYAQVEAPPGPVAELAPDLVRHFFSSLALEGKMNLHSQILRGGNEHHIAEALFKALGRALDLACRPDYRLGDRLPSTKDLIE